MVVTEVEDIMKKTNDVKPEVVDRAAEIARQLRPKVVQESSDKPSINSLFDISNQKDKNVAADGDGGGQVGSKKDEHGCGKYQYHRRKNNTRRCSRRTHERVENQTSPRYGIFERAGEKSKTNKEAEELLASTVEEREEERDNDGDELNWDSSFSKRVRGGTSSTGESLPF